MAERVKFASGRVTAEVAEQLQKSDIHYPGNWDAIEGLSRFRDNVLELESVDKVFLQLDYDHRKIQVLVVGKLLPSLPDGTYTSDNPIRSKPSMAIASSGLLRITNAHLNLTMAFKETGIGSLFLSFYNRTNGERISAKKLSELFFKSDKGPVFAASKKQRKFKLVA